MNKLKNLKVKKKYMVIVSLLLLLVTVVPLIYVGFYSHPAVDDYNYGVYTMNAFNDGGIVNLMKEALRTVKYFYTTWQGTYSATFIMSLQPAVWGQDMYFIGSYILLFSLVFSLFYIMKNIIVDLLKLERSNLIIVACLFLTITVQTVPSLVQGFFWWNGASYYTLFYCFELLSIASLIKIYFLNKKSKLTYAVVCLLTMIIAGGNYITALQQIILLFFLNIYLLYKKKDKSGLIIFLISVVFFGISALAPGNEMRAASSYGMSAYKAILLSFFNSSKYICSWTTILNLIFIFTMLIFLYPSYRKQNFSYKYPVLVSLVTYGIFSAMLTPTLYATSNLGEGRLTNIVYYNFFWFMLINLYYWIGWIRSKLIEGKVVNSNSYSNLINLVNRYSIFIAAISFVLVAQYTYFGKEQISFYKIGKEVMNNSIYTYDKEYRERIEKLEDISLKEVEFERFSQIPFTLFYSDISDDNDSWKNVPLRTIYSKDKLVLNEEYVWR